MTAGAGGDASKRISHTVGGRVKTNSHLTITLEVSLQTKNSLRKVGVFIFCVCVRARAFVSSVCIDGGVFIFFETTFTIGSSQKVTVIMLNFLLWTLYFTNIYGLLLFGQYCMNFGFSVLLGTGCMCP